MGSGASPGFFGKVPVLGDFVSRRLPRDFLDPWDDWLQRAIATSREQLGEAWLDAYLTSPVWRFAFSNNVAGPQAWTGILMPSVDKVGRYFPFTLATDLPGEADLFLLASDAQEWFEGAEILALSALDDTPPDLEALDRDIAELGQPAAKGKGEPKHDIGSSRIGWRLAMPSLTDLAMAFRTLLPCLAEQQFGAYSLWWSAGSDAVAPGMLLCKGLPAAEGFAAMLAGCWQEYGWDELQSVCPDRETGSHEMTG